MEKNRQKVIHKTRLKQQREKKILWVIVILIGLLCINLVSAFDWTDNILAYYDFDSTTLLEDLVDGLYNGTLINAPTTDVDVTLIPKGYTFIDTDEQWINITDLSFGGIVGSINIWFQTDTNSSNMDNVVAPFCSGDGSARWAFMLDGSHQFDTRFGGLYNSTVSSAGYWSPGDWVMLTAVWDTTEGNAKIYLNGTLVVNSTGTITPEVVDVGLGSYKGGADHWFPGNMTEIGIWNRTLSESEIAELYNSGNGLEYEEEEAGELTILLISPIDNTILSTTGVNFTVNYTVSAIYNLTNATYYLWNSTGVFNNSVTAEINGTSNTTKEYINDFTLGNYEWNVYTCWKNTTFLNCSFASANYSFEYVGFSIASESFVNETIEGDTELFSINITMTGGNRISTADLIYNGTAYGGTITDWGGGSYEIIRNLIIPDKNVTTNQTFYWNFIFENDFETNTTIHNQTVYALGIDDCSTHSTLLLNYTLRDEESQEVINASYYNSTIEIDLKLYPVGSSVHILNFSQNYSKNGNPQVCISQNLTNTSEFSLDVQTRYSANSYASEFHHLQNFSITNLTAPQNIDLYDLLSVDAQKFLITYKDENFLPVEDVLIDIQRKYIADGIFKSVEIPKTDDNGQATGHFDLYGVIYTIIVSKQGEVLATFDNIAVVCQDLIIEDCRINLNALATAVSFTEWEKEGGITYLMNFNPIARTITTIFSTTDGSSKTIDMNTTRQDRFGNETICTDSLTSSSGTLTCTIPESFGNVTMITKLYSDGELVTTRIFRITPDSREYFGVNATIMLLIMIITIPLMLISSTIGVVLGIIVGFIMAALLMLYTSGSFLGVASSLIWIIIAGGIIIWKIARRGG